MGLFQEYLNSKGTVEKAKVNITGDLVDPMTSPNAPKGGGKPYASSAGNKVKQSKEKGFGDQGDAKLKWCPKVDHSNGVAPAKIPTAEQAELCAVLVDAIKKDPTITEQMVSQLRRNNLLGMIVAEMLQFKETYVHLAEVMGHQSYGPTVCNKLIRAMTEEVAPPFAASLEDEETEDDEDQIDPDEDINMGDEDDMGQDDMGMENGQDDMGMGPNEISPEGTPPPGMMPPQGMPGMPPGQPPMPGQPPIDPLMGSQAPAGQMPPPAMKNFQRAMMSRF